MSNKMSLESILREFESFKNFEIEELEFTNRELKMIYLCDEFFNYLTYDFELSIEIGFRIFEVLKIIRDKTTFEYIKDKRMYKNYILVINIIGELLDWGTSVRGAFFVDDEFCNNLIDFNNFKCKKSV